MADSFAPSAGAKLSLTTAATRIKLDLTNQANGDAGPTVTIYNAGSVPVVFCFGDVTVVATNPDADMDVTSNVVMPAQTRTLHRGAQPYMSIKAESSTADVYIGVGK